MYRSSSKPKNIIEGRNFRSREGSITLRLVPLSHPKSEISRNSSIYYTLQSKVCMKNKVNDDAYPDKEKSNNIINHTAIKLSKQNNSTPTSNKQISGLSTSSRITTNRDKSSYKSTQSLTPRQKVIGFASKGKNKNETEQINLKDYKEINTNPTQLLEFFRNKIKTAKKVFEDCLRVFKNLSMNNKKMLAELQKKLLAGNEDLQYPSEDKLISNFEQEKPNSPFIIKEGKIKKLARILDLLPKITREIQLILIEKQQSNPDKPVFSTSLNTEKAKMCQDLREKYYAVCDKNETLQKEKAELKKRLIILEGMKNLEEGQLKEITEQLEAANEQNRMLAKKLSDSKLETHKNDIIFGQKMVELQGIFKETLNEKENNYKIVLEELNKQKEEKQYQIIQLQGKCSDLEKALANSESLLRQIEELTSQNKALTEQLEKGSSVNSIDGFRALMSLANMILGRTKRPPAISIKDKQLIREIFDTNTEAMLEEVGTLQQEGKLYREELRKLLAEKDQFILISKSWLQVLSINHHNN